MVAGKTLRMLYYAAFREAAGVSEEDVQTAAATAVELYDEVAARHQFSFDRSILRVVLNDKIVPWSTSLTDGDTVVFLAPYAGG